MSKEGFDRFINKKVTGAKKKEQIKQEKKKIKKEREAFFIEKKRKHRAEKKTLMEAAALFEDIKKFAKPKEVGAAAPAKPYNKNKTSLEKTKHTIKKSSQPKVPEVVKKFNESKPTEKAQATEKPRKSLEATSTYVDKKPNRFKKPNEPKSTYRSTERVQNSQGQKWPINRNTGERDKKPDKPKAKGGSVILTNTGGSEKATPQKINKIETAKPFKEESKKEIITNKIEPAPGFKSKKELNFKSAATVKLETPARAEKKLVKKTFQPKQPKPANDPGLPYARKQLVAKEPVAEGEKPKTVKPKIDLTQPSLMPLNKFIAHGGLCSRRDAGIWVKEGKVKLNGVVVTDPGTKVNEGDEVVANGKKVVKSTNLVYILLNKPKDFITTVEDPQGRKTVLDIVKGATNERVYPVGRLDRNTSGVLLLTNDGELAQHLTHPSFEVRKIYEAKLDKPLVKADFEKLISGITLEDGFVQADSVAYADNKDKSVIGIEIHSGRNRVVRRMFESLGYDVRGLDRVLFANLTKKNVERGKWRLLNEKEVRLLKFFNKSKAKISSEKP